MTSTSTSHSAFTKLRRAFLFTIAGIVGFALFILIGLAAVNFFDERESPGTRAALTPPNDPTPDDRNLYFAMVRFTAAPGESIVGDGISCAPLDSPLWADTKTRAAETAAAVQANHVMLERYASLHAYTGYFETARPSHPPPSVKIARAVRCLYLAATAAALQSADAARQIDAARNFSQDLSMWRTVLVGEGTMLSKMLAGTELQADLRLAAAACADPATPSSILEALGLQPFDLKDWKLTAGYAAEYRAVAQIFRELQLTPAAKAYASHESSSDSVSLWQRLLADYKSLFFKYNATMNLGAAQLHELMKMSETDPEHYEDAYAAYEHWSDDHIRADSLRSLYNPTGRTLVALAAINNDYQLRAYDYAAFQRMVFLAYQIRSRNIIGNDVRKFMAIHPEWSTHPVNGKFFVWDGVSKLTMTPMATRGTELSRYVVAVVEH